MFTDSLHNSKNYGPKIQLVLFSFHLTMMHYFVFIFRLKIPIQTLKSHVVTGQSSVKFRGYEYLWKKLYFQRILITQSLTLITLTNKSFFSPLICVLNDRVTKTKSLSTQDQIKKIFKMGRIKEKTRFSNLE